MKLLLDQNLSRKLVKALSGLYPGSVHVTACNIEALLRMRPAEIKAFGEDEDSALLVLP